MNLQRQNIRISDYDYGLPNERIAGYALEQRDQSKLLVYRNGLISDHHFVNIARHLPENSTVVLNDTRVIEARLLFQKSTGGIIEIFCLEPFNSSIETSLLSHATTQWLCLIGGASKWKAGQLLQKIVMIADEAVTLTAKYISKLEDSFIIEFSWEPQQFPFAEILHAAGAIPLPPYIKRQAIAADKERYQTIFAREEGSVAAPTAALHFTENVFEDLKAKQIDVGFVTLHVGAGTFKPVKTETITEHQMHREPFTVSIDLLKKLITSKQIIAVGTTSLRTLETLHWLGVKQANGLVNGEWKLNQWEAYELQERFGKISNVQSLQSLVDYLEENKQEELHCETSLLIVPGYQFNIPSALITNFHQPQSTLLLLIAAFIGEDWKKVYRHALDNDYRFLSYGDSSLLMPAPSLPPAPPKAGGT
jgi:S-adenosylmethionine:tRNA ribosyltransferase-isomerase